MKSPNQFQSFASIMFWTVWLLVCSSANAVNQRTLEVIKCSSLLEFDENNGKNSGVVIEPTLGWYTVADVQRLKNSYPVPLGSRNGKIVIHMSNNESQAKSYFAAYPEYKAFYESQPILKVISEKMRERIIESLPVHLRSEWLKKPYVVSVQWSSGEEPVLYDHRFHVHHDQIVASLTLDGDAGTLVKIPFADITNLDFHQIYEIGDSLSGYEYQAKEGELVIINSVHFRAGGLHAAPAVSGHYPSRMTILVGIAE